MGITQESRADYIPCLGMGVTKRPWRERRAWNIGLGSLQEGLSGIIRLGPLHFRAADIQRGITSLVSRQAPYERQSRFFLACMNKYKFSNAASDARLLIRITSLAGLYED